MIKKYFKIKNILLLSFLILISFVVIRLISDWSFPDTNWQITKDEKVELKKEDPPILQKFKANRDGLSKIEVLLGSAKINGSLEMKILDENCKKVLREDRMKESVLDSNKTYAFKFSKIPDSKDRIFCFSISSNAQKTGSKFPSIFMSESPAPGGGSLQIPFVNGEIQDKSLSIRPGYQNLKISENLTELNQRISQYKPFFLKHYYLWAISITFIVLSVGLVVALIRM